MPEEVCEKCVDGCVCGENCDCTPECKCEECHPEVGEDDQVTEEPTATPPADEAV